MDTSSHTDTYKLFLQGVGAAILHAALVLVALAAFTFGKTLPLLLGIAIIVIGSIVVLIDFKRRSHYGTSLALLGIFVVLTAIDIG
jgi:hypothetical protein